LQTKFSAKFVPILKNAQEKMADEEEIEQQEGEAQENEENKKPTFNYDELEPETDTTKAPFLFKAIEKKIFTDFMKDIENHKHLGNEDGGEAGEFDKEGWMTKYQEEKTFDLNRIKSVVLLGVC